MNKEKEVFDKEWVAKPIIFLKGIGCYCVVCNKHMFPRQKNQTCCSKKCRERKRSRIRRRTDKDVTGLHCFVNLKPYGVKNQYRIMKLYLKKGVIQEVKITPESKELWALLEKIKQFRDSSIPLVEITA